MIDALVISMINDSKSSLYTRKCIQSFNIHNQKNVDNIMIFPATLPETAVKDLRAVIGNKNFKYEKENFFKIKKPSDKTKIESINYTWPIKDTDNRLDIKTGLFFKAYAAADYRKIVACTISHMRAWMYAIENNKDVLVLEHDAFFSRQFDYQKLYDQNPKFGIVSLNSPFSATRRPAQYDAWLKRYKEENPANVMHMVPSVNLPQDPKLPQGLPGNSAYIVQPWAAEKLLEKVSELGIWPNDAVICKEFFPWIKSVYPYITTVQGTPSTTTR